MTEKKTNSEIEGGLTRRDLLIGSLAGGIVGAAGSIIYLKSRKMVSETFIGSVESYQVDISSIFRDGFRELGVTEREIHGKRILLKPNLVEVFPGAGHINTHPLVIRGAIEAFLSLGASKVLVGEGPGHGLDFLYALEESGVSEILREDRIPFVNLNNDASYRLANRTGFTNLKKLSFSTALAEVDWIVSMAKMKTHHWAGVTLSMKNMFGVMPGIAYGWPKNVLHQEGIGQSIIDINATLRPHFAIVDGILGMEGDGPIMGTPKQAGVLVMGRNLPAVDATCARIMGIDAHKISYLKVASSILGSIEQDMIEQRGEVIEDVRTDFSFLAEIPSHRLLKN